MREAQLEIKIQQDSQELLLEFYPDFVVLKTFTNEMSGKKVQTIVHISKKNALFICEIVKANFRM